MVQFVADGVFYAELNELLTRELAADGYSGVEVRVTPLRTEIIIRATRTQNVLGTCHESFLMLGSCGVGVGRRRNSIRVYFPSMAGFDGRFVRN